MPSTNEKERGERGVYKLCGSPNILSQIPSHVLNCCSNVQAPNQMGFVQESLIRQGVVVPNKVHLATWLLLNHLTH